MEPKALVTDPASIARYLRSLGEPADAPPLSPARAPPYWKSRVLRRKPAQQFDQTELFDAYPLRPRQAKCHSRSENVTFLTTARDRDRSRPAAFRCRPAAFPPLAPPRATLPPEGGKCIQGHFSAQRLSLRRAPGRARDTPGAAGGGRDVPADDAVRTTVATTACAACPGCWPAAAAAP